MRTMASAMARPPEVCRSTTSRSRCCNPRIRPRFIECLKCETAPSDASHGRAVKGSRPSSAQRYRIVCNSVQRKPDYLLLPRVLVSRNEQRVLLRREYKTGFAPEQYALLIPGN